MVLMNTYDFVSNRPHFQDREVLNLLLELWVSVNSTGKVSDGCIRDLGFIPRLHQKLIGVLV